MLQLQYMWPVAARGAENITVCAAARTPPFKRTGGETGTQTQWQTDKMSCLVVTQAKEKLKQGREWSVGGGFAVSDGQAVVGLREGRQ